MHDSGSSARNRRGIGKPPGRRPGITRRQLLVAFLALAAAAIAFIFAPRKGTTPAWTDGTNWDDGTGWVD